MTPRLLAGGTASARRARTAAARADRQHGARHVVLVAPTRSDAGSRAVLEAVLELSGGPVDLVLDDDAGPPLLAPARATVNRVPALLTGVNHGARGAVALVGRLLAEARHCSVIAPDTISSRDDLRAFVRCVALARRAARDGVDARIIGLCWTLGGGTGIPAVQAAARAGVQCFVRDDLSLMSAMNEGLPGLHPAADLAFAGTDRDPTVLDEIDARGRPIAVLAVCAAITPGADPAADYVAIADHLQRRGSHVVLLPSSPGGYDLLLLGRVFRAIAAGGATVVRRPLGTAELRALAGAARLVVADRVRTAVVALSAGSSVLALATQRDLEALMRAAGLSACAMTPAPGFSDGARVLVDGMLGDEAAVRRTIRHMLPGTVALARANLRGLPGSGGASVPVGLTG